MLNLYIYRPFTDEILNYYEELNPFPSTTINNNKNKFALSSNKNILLINNLKDNYKSFEVTKIQKNKKNCFN